MDAVLYICHGSRLKEACDEAVEFVEKCKKLRTEPIQIHCFLELAEPTITQAIKMCVERGATKIHAIPVLLLSAAHAKHDIPLELDEALKEYPFVEFKFGNPIGVQTSLVDLLAEHIKETGKQVTARSKIWIVGRGSTDVDVKRDLGTIAMALETKIHHPVETCFLTGCKPYFTDVMNKIDDEVDQVFILPYFLFTGLLMKGIQKNIEKSGEKNTCEYILCDYLGSSDVIVSALNERINEMMLSSVS